MWSWGTLPRAPGAAHTPSAPHSWELKINQEATKAVDAAWRPLTAAEIHTKMLNDNVESTFLQ